MLFYENIQDALGVEVEIGQKMASTILLWHKMYEDEAPWINEKNEVRSCGIPSAICTNVAIAVAMEASIEITGSPRADYINGELDVVKDDITNIVEYACAGGDLALKPYVVGDHIAVD